MSLLLAGTPESTSGFFGVPVVLLIIYVVFCRSSCVLCHCIVCASSIYGFLLPLYIFCLVLHTIYILVSNIFSPTFITTSGVNEPLIQVIVKKRQLN